MNTHRPPSLVTLCPCGTELVVDTDLSPDLAKSGWRILRSTTSTNHPYAVRGIRKPDGRRSVEFQHRVIVGATNRQVVDHINGDTLDNRRCNLRLCTAEGNNRNVRRSKRQKLGGYKGVTWNPRARKWEAGIAVGDRGPNGKKKRLYLGVYTDPIAAARAYDEAGMRHFGEFAALNFEFARKWIAALFIAEAAEAREAAQKQSPQSPPTSTQRAPVPP